MKLNKRINLVFVCEIFDDSFSFIEISRKLMFNNININLRAECYTIELLGFGLRIFVDKSIKVEKQTIEKIKNKTMESLNLGNQKGQKTGWGTISLETYKKEEEYITYLKYEFRNMNTEGTISELKKLIKKLEKE